MAHRKKRIAHTDAPVRLGGPTTSLQGVTVGEIDGALQRIANIVNATAPLFGEDGNISYAEGEFAHTIGETGAERLCRYLKASLQQLGPD
jgi:hypothetical protein